MLLNWEEFRAFSDLGKGKCLWFVLEPYDAIKNNYNVSLGVLRDKITMEIVGPGFDASDLQRSHASPHEIYSFSRLYLRLRKTYLISGIDYGRSVNLRKEKVFEKYLNKSHSFVLQERNVDLRWSPPSSYTPIQKRKLEYVLKLALSILPSTDAIFNWPYTLAASYLDEGRRLVFWDVFAGPEPFRIRSSSF